MTNFDLYKLLHLVVNKDIYSNWIKPEEFELELKAKNIRLLRDRLGLPERYVPGTANAGPSATSIIETDLDPFLELKDVTVTNQETIITNWYFINDFYTSSSIVSEIISLQELSSRLRHPIRVEDTKYPFAIRTNKGLKIWPESITSATVSYYRRPTDPIFSTNVNSQTGELEYDSTASFELEWKDENKLDVLHLILQDMGVNIERQDVEALANKYVEGGK